MSAQFIHLRVHSAYSLAEGAIRIKELISRCQDYEMPAVAVTDTSNLFGALEFSTSAAKSGIQPIIGSQMAIARPEGMNFGSTTMEEPDQMVLLAQNEAGYLNLIKLSSQAFCESGQENPTHVTWEQLESCNEGLICLTGGPKGSIGRQLGEKRKDDAEETLKTLHRIFEDRLYIELLRHGSLDEARIEDDLLDLAYAHNIPIVATNNCYFTDREMYKAHDALLCIAAGRYVIEEDRPKVTAEHYFKSPQEMIELFSDLPEAIENTVKIAQRCSYVLKMRDPILPRFETDEGETEDEAMTRQSEQGLDWRLEKYVFTAEHTDAEKQELRDEYYKRLKYELDVLLQMGFAGYFLIVADFIQWAKEQDIPVGPGRGSGAGSLVAWALRITDLDPIRFGLLFERFLNPDRVSMPDFDIDFCQDRRDEVIRYVQDKYGRDRVAQIITFGKLQARAVVRDVGRVLQISYGYVDKIAKMVPSNPANPVSLQEALDQEPDLRAARDSDETIGNLITIALQLEGLYRHASTHAAGIVIGDRPLDHLVPLYLDPRSDMPATQFNMKYVESAGLVKFDFLGLKTLSIIKKAVDTVKQTSGETLDPLKFPLEDEKTFQMLARADNAAVFQLESAGMQDLCRQMRVKNFDEAAAIIALYRPGPMENIPRYLACQRGDEELDYMHPLLEPVVKDTYGVMIYQEQVMQAAQVMAGYTLGGADLLRRAMGKKIKEEMDAQREIFTEGCKKFNNVDAEKAGEIFDQINKFAGYGFNKAHTYAYALVAYQTAYLKAHYPVEFMAATMTYDMGNTDKLAFFRQELLKMGIPLLAPDINRSEVDFAVQTEDEISSIRYALAGLKGVGGAAMESLIAERAANGAYADLFDLAQRSESKVLNKRQLESLVAAGAFDEINGNRAEVMASIEIILKYATTLAQEKESGQESLFGGADDVQLDKPPLPKIIPYEPLEKLEKEFKAVGFYLSAHPLDSMEVQLDRLGITSFSNVQRRLREVPGSRLKMAGIVTKKQEKISAKGNRFAFVQLSDSTGVYEAMIFSEVLSASRDIIQVGNTVLAEVDVQIQGEDDIRFLAQRFEPLDKAVDFATKNLTLTISAADNLEEIKNILDTCGYGKVKVYLELEAKARHVEMTIPASYALTGDEISVIRKLEGVEDVSAA
jgi:DNA polymerase-3 subunit alpha